MFILKTYEDEALGYQINPGDTILDVGANIGSFSLLAAHKQAGQIFAIEPAKEVFELLQENIRLNGRKNISLFNLALDAGEGVRELQLGDAQASFHWKSPFGAVQMVPTLSLGMFLERNHVARVDFLKMDCEGSEFDVLFNSDRAVLRKIHRFAIEFHNLSPEKNADTLKEDLEAKGFSIDLCRGEWNGLILARNKNFEPDMMPEPRAAGSL